MASQDASQSQKATDTQYPSESSAFAGQRVWVSPEFGKSLDLYRWIVSNHSATLVEQIGEKDVFHLLPTFQGVRDSFNNYISNFFAVIDKDVIHFSHFYRLFLCERFDSRTPN